MNDREVTTAGDEQVGEDRRAFLSKYGKLALVAPPAITMMLSTSMASPAIASSTGGNPQKGNNGLGNGPDPQPPGNPPVNDGLGQNPGNPGNNGGNGGNGGNSANSNAGANGKGKNK